VTGGRVVKGVNFVGAARRRVTRWKLPPATTTRAPTNSRFLDITATSDGRDLILHIIEAVASQVFIPLTVGGGVRTVDDVRRLLNAGADKTSFNSAAIANPQVIEDASRKYGAQCIVVAIDAKRRSGEDALVAWPRLGCLQPRRPQKHAAWMPWPGRAKMAGRGAGEILLTSMDRDGTKSGFDLALTRAVADAVSVPVIASGGVGNLDHLADGVQQGGADAVLAASIFHYGEFHLSAKAKAHLARRGVPMRLPGCPARPPTRMSDPHQPVQRYPIDHMDGAVGGQDIGGCDAAAAQHLVGERPARWRTVKVPPPKVVMGLSIGTSALSTSNT